MTFPTDFQDATPPTGALTELPATTARGINALATLLNGKQPGDTDLTAIAALTSAANKLPYATGPGTWDLANYTPLARTFTAAATAAAARLAIEAIGQNELVFNVKDYGATGDGTTNDTAAFQAAVDAVGDSTGAESYGVLFVPAGDYKILSTITVKSNLWICGAGERTFIDFTTPTASGDILFEWSGTSIDDFVITDMRIRGEGMDSGDGSGQCIAVYLNGTTNIERFKAFRLRVERFRFGIYLRADTGKIEAPEVRDCWFDENSYAGLRMINTRNARVAGNTVDCDRSTDNVIGNGVAGVCGIWISELTSGSLGHLDIGIHDNNVYNASAEGINCHSKYANITANNVRSCATGIMLEPFIKTSPADGDVKLYGTIAGNTVRDCSQVNIIVRHDPVNNTRAVGRVAITGNTTAGGPTGIRVGQGGATTAGPLDVTVTGNVCMDHTAHGIRLTAVRRCAVGDNVAAGCTTAGLSVDSSSKLVSITGGCYNATGSSGDCIIIQDSASYVTITGVTVDNCDRSGIRISGTANFISINGLVAIDDQGTPTMDNAVTVTSSGTSIFVDGQPITAGTVGAAFSGVKSVNGYGTESANAETPTAANWKTGNIVKFTDSGDGTGNGTYILDSNGTTWTRIDNSGGGGAGSVGADDVGINWYPPIYVSGNYYACNSTSAISTSNTLGNGNLRLSQWIVVAGITITRLWVEHTSAGDATSVFRIGIYNDDGTGKPGTLLLDAGTVATSGAAAVQEITVSQGLSAGIYWVGGAVQGVTTTQPTMRTVTANGLENLISYGTSLPAVNSTRVSYLQASVNGALPSTASVSGAGAGPPRIGFKVA